ncbi:hypothetical protein M440DRAFT_1254545 [Trichoderma longibrachiatum ATCC 18648]|uniref:Secreted protein n=1 Tax=Trichoderma longibrachiatum ATCC 18648 TaxID=983965 RepID=A0A2T4C4Q3_TRILO|nr:hypothetical protein M440DRAFT_1254545 [Trichoderma longibrachiatum ATCC 18648]
MSRQYLILQLMQCWVGGTAAGGELGKRVPASTAQQQASDYPTNPHHTISVCLPLSPRWSEPLLSCSASLSRLPLRQRPRPSPDSAALACACTQPASPNDSISGIRPFASTLLSVLLSAEGEGG